MHSYKYMEKNSYSNLVILNRNIYIVLYDDKDMKEIECFKCGHKWLPRVKQPRCCPKCRSRYFHEKGYTKCAICSKNFLRMSVHHINGNHEDNRKSNLIRICIFCHTAIHKGIGRQRKQGIRGGKSKINDYGLWRGKNGKVEVINKLKFYQNKLK